MIGLQTVKLAANSNLREASSIPWTVLLFRTRDDVYFCSAKRSSNFADVGYISWLLAKRRGCQAVTKLHSTP